MSKLLIMGDVYLAETEGIRLATQRSIDTIRTETTTRYMDALVALINARNHGVRITDHSSMYMFNVIRSSVIRARHRAFVEAEESRVHFNGHNAQEAESAHILEEVAIQMDIEFIYREFATHPNSYQLLNTPAGCEDTTLTILGYFDSHVDMSAYDENFGYEELHSY
jgi:hypothetical protein